MKVINVPIHAIKPYENNVKQHPVAQLEILVKSIQRYGFRGTILLDKNNVIVAGHARYEAASVAGLSELPCEYADDLTEEQIIEYRILDNKIASMGFDDNDKFLEEAAKVPDFNWDDFGVELPTVEVIPEEGLTGDDETPELKVDATTKPGDVWILGDHRLICGDSTDINNFDKLMNGNAPVLMVTDPPYGVKYDPEWRDGADLGVGERSRGKVENDDKVDWSDAYSLFTGSVAYVWHAGIHSHTVAQNLVDCGFEVVSQIIWVKQHFALSRGDYHWQHEPCLYVVRKGEKHNWQGARDQATTWNIKNNNSFGNSNKEETFGHGTQKPVECMIRPIQNNTQAGDYVYDPFGGSGTTMIACDKIKRKCLMAEISSSYCDMIVKRWQKFTGKEAVLESTGKRFNELSPLV